jgi:hypothetical protein
MKVNKNKKYWKSWTTLIFCEETTTQCKYETLPHLSDVKPLNSINNKHLKWRRTSNHLTTAKKQASDVEALNNNNKHLSDVEPLNNTLDYYSTN